MGGVGPAQQGTARLSEVANHSARVCCSLLPPRAGPSCFHQVLRLPSPLHRDEHGSCYGRPMSADGSKGGGGTLVLAHGHTCPPLCTPPPPPPPTPLARVGSGVSRRQRSIARRDCSYLRPEDRHEGRGGDRSRQENKSPRPTLFPPTSVTHRRSRGWLAQWRGAGVQCRHDLAKPTTPDNNHPICGGCSCFCWCWLPRVDEPHRHPAVRRQEHLRNNPTMTTSPPWYELPDERPNDGEEYWVVQYRWMSTPVKATWNDTDQTWRATSGGGDVPWYVFPWYRKQ
jgi:hypothetical protein